MTNSYLGEHLESSRIAREFFFAAQLFLCLVSVQSTLAVGYTATLLHPAGFAESSAVGVSGGSQVGAGYASDTQLSHALLWNGTAASVVDLNPNGFFHSQATAASDTYQVGYGLKNDGSFALLWYGTPDSVVNLNPPGFVGSAAYAASGTNQVGQVITPSPRKGHAYLWSGSANTGVDLHPASGYFESQANGVSGGTEVGHVTVNFTGARHAVLWTGSAASMVDLNGSYLSSDANAVSGNNQVGFGYVNVKFQVDVPHALIWHGASASAVDLNPQGFASSEAFGVSASGQVGYGALSSSGMNHALYWSGTAASAIDLHSSLSGLGHTFLQSEALAINADGSIVGRAYDDSSSSYYAVLWTPQFIPGDFNHDDRVDGQDYVTWRKGLGNQYTTDDYNVWRVHFGQHATSGDSSPAAPVPEPTTATLLLLGMLGCGWRRR